MENGKHTAILAISEIDKTTINDARRLFFAYKEKSIITDGLFDDDRWSLCDEYARYHLDFQLDSKAFEEFSFKMKITEEEFINYMKTYLQWLCQCRGQLCGNVNCATGGLCYAERRAALLSKPKH